MRVSDWPERLHIALSDELEKPFAWGKADCVQMAVASVKACRGDHWQSPIKITWETEMQAHSKIKEITNGGDLGDAFEMQFEEIPVSMAQRGDIGIVGNAAVICIGTTFVGKTTAGRAFLQTSQVKRAFRV